MKNTLLLLIFTGLLLSCASTKSAKQKFSRDDLHIVTPAVEVSSFVGRDFTAEYEDREQLKTQVLNTLKSELNKTDHYELALMSKDYRTMNKILEGNPKAYDKSNDSHKNLTAFEEVLIQEKKYTLFVQIHGSYAKNKRELLDPKDGGVMYIRIVNNENKTFDQALRYEYDFSPMNYEKLEKLIIKGIKKLTL